jgi:hypothetical protein
LGGFFSTEKKSSAPPINNLHRHYFSSFSEEVSSHAGQVCLQVMPCSDSFKEVM